MTTSWSSCSCSLETVLPTVVSNSATPLRADFVVVVLTSLSQLKNMMSSRQLGLDCHLIEDPISLTAVSDTLRFLRRNHADIVMSAIMIQVRLISRESYNIIVLLQLPAGLWVWECSPIPFPLIIPFLEDVVVQGGGGAHKLHILVLAPGVLRCLLDLT